MSNFVFVLDAKKNPLSPCHPSVARKLLKQGKAAVLRRYPFTIILKKECQKPTETIKLKLDPGSKTTGIALVQQDKLIWGAELIHRGQQIKDNLLTRRQIRRSRRNRKTRYRQARFLNRTRLKGWLPPSLRHRVETTMTWVKRICKFVHVTNISVELVKFDTQALDNPEISGKEYQQGELFGYEIREYLLEKWGRRCVYCGIKDVPLEVEHILAKSKGGSDRCSNLTISCRICNQLKGNQDIKDFLSNQPSLLEKILKQSKQSLKNVAAVNTTRWALFNKLKETGLSIETGTGGRTKYNRCRLNLEKRHFIDAGCVGNLESLKLLTRQPLLIKATGHGNRQMCGINKYGFPIRHRSRNKFYKGFQTGAQVKAVVTKGKKVGVYLGRVLCRASGRFDIASHQGRTTGITYKFCTAIQKKDGYNYEF
ncbi:RNA-guided endonuclease IscB [Gloeothece verrucosa]|uniref:HNH endonuclease n=1 Tax=Gloeothece verrucosa (strain PCC 7822) TaxID=497965 RepID=E0UMD9_GLOV7|nr:RNA-guided endonuclease IscB [Gloeothece verrucosa]ADN18119.1 HNH endonuclease [Gloeothece verrucosa PCC 7822]